MNDIRGFRGSSRRTYARVEGSPVLSDAGSMAEKGKDSQINNKGFRRKKVLAVGGAVVILLLAATSVFFFWQYKNSRSSDESAVSQRIISDVSGLYFVPEGEEPTVAEIKDINKLRDQAFFDKAQNGDYLLVYNDAKIAIIYRKSDNKLVNVSPVNPNPGADSNTQQGVMGESTDNASRKDPKPADPGEVSE